MTVKSADRMMLNYFDTRIKGLHPDKEINVISIFCLFLVGRNLDNFFIYDASLYKTTFYHW